MGGSLGGGLVLIWLCFDGEMKGITMWAKEAQQQPLNSLWGGKINYLVSNAVIGSPWAGIPLSCSRWYRVAGVSVELGCVGLNPPPQAGKSGYFISQWCREVWKACCCQGASAWDYFPCKPHPLCHPLGFQLPKAARTAQKTHLSSSFIPLRTSALEDSSPSNVLWPSWGADAVLWVPLVRICGRWVLPGAAPADREPAIVEVIYVYRHSGVVKIPQMLPLGLQWTELIKNIPTDGIGKWSKHPRQGLLLGSGLFYFIFGHQGCAPIS